MLNDAFAKNVSNVSYQGTYVDTTSFTDTEDILTKVLYILLSLIDVVGNSLIMYVIAKDMRNQNTVNLLIVNLSVSDIFAGLAIYPYLFLKISPADQAAGRADYLCGFKSGLPLFFGASTVNFLTLAVLSVSRYLLISYPTNPRWRVRRNRVKWISIATWVIGLSLPLPNIVSLRYLPETGTCKRHWPAWFNRPVFFIFTAILYFVAFSSLVLTYVSSVYTLWFSPSTVRLARLNSHANANSGRKRVAILLGLLMLTFSLCWCPFVVYWILSAAMEHFKDTLEDHIKKVRLLRFTLLAAMMNMCIDPFIYAIGNRQIKAGLKRLFGLRYSNHVAPATTGNE